MLSYVSMKLTLMGFVLEGCSMCSGRLSHVILLAQHSKSYLVLQRTSEASRKGIRTWV